MSYQLLRRHLELAIKTCQLKSGEVTKFQSQFQNIKIPNTQKASQFLKPPNFKPKIQGPRRRR